MRDNHDTMPELLQAYERDGHFFGAVSVTLGAETRELEFGLPPDDYSALRHILQFRPFDTYLGARYRYFVASCAFRIGRERVELAIRIEQARSARQFPFEVPRSLGANLLWFAQLRDFGAALHLRAPQLTPGNT